jgi:hypothetical protein
VADLGQPLGIGSEHAIEHGRRREGAEHAIGVGRLGDRFEGDGWRGREAGELPAAIREPPALGPIGNQGPGERRERDRAGGGAALGGDHVGERAARGDELPASGEPAREGDDQLARAHPDPGGEPAAARALLDRGGGRRGAAGHLVQRCPVFGGPAAVERVARDVQHVAPVRVDRLDHVGEVAVERPGQLLQGGAAAGGALLDQRAEPLDIAQEQRGRRPARLGTRERHARGEPSEHQARQVRAERMRHRGSGVEWMASRLAGWRIGR